MIEFGVFSNGAGTLPGKYAEEFGRYIVDGDMAAVRGQAEEVLPAQIRWAVLAEKVGFDYWWQSEHHFQPEGAEFSPSSLIQQAAIASQTKRIRIGQMANILPWWHPLRLAEQLATLDILTGGRLEVGVGRGYQPRETEVFGQIYGSSTQDQERNRAYFEEAYELLITCWTELSFSFHGDFFNLPPKWTKWHNEYSRAYFSQPGVGRTVEQVMNYVPTDQPMTNDGGPSTLREMSVLPSPAQKPHPQIWMPLTSPRSMIWAAERGINGYYPAVPDEMLKNTIGLYWKTAEKHGFPDRLDRGEFKFGYDAERRRGIGLQKFVHIHDKNIGDKERYDIALRMQWDYLTPFGFGALVPRADGKTRAPGAPVDTQDLYDSGIALAGTPEQICESIINLKEYAGFDDLLFSAELPMGGFTETEVAEQIQCYGEEVIPVLRRELGGSPEHPELGHDYSVPYEQPVSS
jgi:alkanesulfonate monooxygenase SsuD/methylene tetrahydromethanopterin reductase-like flavin-dependent oxidoreductase (luciferase family)